jgi:tetratricopeptide (TPR) repeat protein
MTYDKRWLLTIPLLLLGASALAVHQHSGPDQQTACIPEASDARQAVNVLDVEELLAEYTLAVNAARAALERGRWADAAALTPPPGSFAWSRFPQAWAATYVARAIGAARLGHTARARQDLEQLRLLGDILLANGACDWAYEVVIRHRVAAAWVVYRERQYEEAVQLMRTAADLEDSSTKYPMLMPPIALAHESLGQMLLERGEPGYALQAFETALRGHPRRLHTLYGAALAAELSGDLTTAQAFYLRLVDAAEQARNRIMLAQAQAFLANGQARDVP